MKKNISKGQVIKTVLELLHNDSDIDKLNFREIARTLGCAHTNLYNYFPSYSELLWECHSAILCNFITEIKKHMNDECAEHSLNTFFEAIVNMYMDNKGWFRLSWHEYIKGERPESDIETAGAANQLLTDFAMDICSSIFPKCPDKKNIKRILHNTHCYIIGEISNYLLKRSFTDNETEFRAYIISEAALMFRLCLTGTDNTGRKI